MKSFVLISGVNMDSSRPLQVSMPSASRFDTFMLLLPVVLCLIGYEVMRRWRLRRAAEKRAQRKARGTLLTAMRIASRLSKPKVTPMQRAMERHSNGPRFAMYDLNRFRVGDRVLYPCGTEATVIGVDEDGDLHVFLANEETRVWYAKRCRKSMSIGDRVLYEGCEGTIDGFDKDDKLMVTQPCGCTDVWPRSLTTRLISVGDRVHYVGDVMGTVEGFDEDGDYKVTIAKDTTVVFYAVKCEQGIGSLNGQAMPGCIEDLFNPV